MGGKGLMSKTKTEREWEREREGTYRAVPLVRVPST